MAEMRSGAAVVYLAGPYSTPDPCVNTHAAIQLADRLLDICVPMVPHLTHFWHTVSPKPYERWLELDLVMLERCDVVYRFGGDSAGADGEVAHAISVGIPVVYTEEYLRSWIAAR